MISEFLKILELISFDEILFRKEFVKTLKWVLKEDYPVIEEWMVLILPFLRSRINKNKFSFF